MSTEVIGRLQHLREHLEQQIKSHTELQIKFGTRLGTYGSRSVAFHVASRGAQLANSYSRMEAVMRAGWPLLYRGARAELEWFALLGEEWSVCDNIWEYVRDLKYRLRRASREHLDAMITEKERKALATLPAMLTVYRGCYQANRNGLSWTLDRATAERFPRLMRYRAEGRPLLRIGRLRRDRAVLMLEREEQEIVAAGSV